MDTTEKKKYWTLWRSRGVAVVDYDGVFIGNALDVTEAKAISQRHNNEIHGVFNYHKQKDIDSITGEHALSQPPKEL